MSIPRRSTRAKSDSGSPTKSTRSIEKDTASKSNGKKPQKQVKSKHFLREKSGTPDDTDANLKDETDSSEEKEDGDAYGEDEGDEAEEAEESMDSDTIDDEDFDEAPRKKSPKKSQSPAKNLKRKRRSEVGQKTSRLSSSSPKKQKNSTEEHDDEGSDEGLEVIGEIIQAPTTGRGEYG